MYMYGLSPYFFTLHFAQSISLLLRFQKFTYAGFLKSHDHTKQWRTRLYNISYRTCAVANKIYSL